MRKFDYMEFCDHYGILFDSDIYSQKEAKEIFLKEYGDRCSYNENDVIILEDYVKWYPKMSKEDMWYFDIFDSKDNRGTYKCCSKDTPRAFKVWRLRTREEVEKYADD